MVAIRTKVARSVDMEDGSLHYNSYIWACAKCGYHLLESWAYCPRCAEETLIKEQKEAYINESKRKAKKLRSGD